MNVCGSQFWNVAPEVSFTSRLWIDFWVGVKVLQDGKMSMQPLMIVYTMLAFVTVHQVFSVFSFVLDTSAEALLVALQSCRMWVHRNLFWQLSRDGSLHGSGMSHAMTASPKPFFRAPRRVGNTVIGRGNAGWTTSKSEHPCNCQNCSQGRSAEKTGRGSVLNHLSCPPNDPVGQGTELNWKGIALGFIDFTHSSG